MRRHEALRLLGAGLLSGAMVGCQDDLCNPVPASIGLPSKPTAFGSAIYPDDDVEKALDLVAGCGGSIVRIGLDGVTFDFADAVLAGTAQRGMRVVLLSPYGKQPVDINAYVSTCVAIQQRYAKYNPIWEIWNEPNLAVYWGTTPSAVDYAKLAIATAQGLRAAGAVDIWSGGTSGVDVSWIIQITKLGVFNVMNGCAVHAYLDPCGTFAAYRSVIGTVPAGIQIHTTETCVPSDKDQANFLRQMWYTHRTLGIPTMIWCELRDGTAGTTGQYTFPYGLVYSNYSPKPSYYIAQAVILPQTRAAARSGRG